MNRTLLRSLLGTALLFGWSLLGKTVAAGAERPGIESVIEGLKRADDAFFESAELSLRYACSESVNMVSSPQMLRAEWLLGRDDDGWCTEGKALEPRNIRGKTVPAQPTINILKKGLFLDWNQNIQNVFLRPHRLPNDVRHFNVLHGWQYLENAGVNPYRPVIESTGMSYEAAMALEKSILQQWLSAPLLPDFLEKNASKYRVAEQTESIDGEACWAIEWPEMDKIWVNVDRGCTVRRRVFHWKPAGPLARQVDNSDFREVKPGLWFCFRQMVETYGRLDGDEDHWGKIINRSTYEVSECDFSRAPEALTDLHVTRGTFVTDVIRNLQYKVYEEGDPLEKPLGEARQWDDDVRKPPAAIVPRHAGFVRSMTIGVAALLVLLALSFLLRRKARRQIGWSSNRRGWLTFSLRGFLIAVTVGCTWLGWNVERARRRGRAIDAISAAGNTVLYDYYEDFLHEVQNRLPRHFWSDLRGIPVHVLFHEGPLSPAIVRQLSDIGGISRLWILRECSAAELDSLGGLSNCGEIVFTQGVADDERRRLQRKLPKAKIGLQQRGGAIAWSKSTP